MKYFLLILGGVPKRCGIIFQFFCAFQSSFPGDKLEMSFIARSGKGTSGKDINKLTIKTQKANKYVIVWVDETMEY